MKKIYIISILIVLLNINVKPKNNISNNNNIKKTELFGTLIIKKINLKEDIYNIGNKNNTIEKHVTILEQSIIPELIIIAAHSGTGKIAYFERLDELKINDEITLINNKKKKTYIVKEIWEEKKNGYININKEKKNQLVLTTCSPKNNKYQLIVNCIIKDK